MINYFLAYASKATDYEWVRFSGFDNVDTTIKLAMIRAKEMPNCAIGIFINHENETGDWRDRRPRLLYNRHVLAENAVSSAVAGFINSIHGGQI